jgi:acyl carrier protein phosphodiesterase
VNFLAHFYLSQNDEDLIVGNFLGDMMKRSEWSKLPEPIKKGVLLHLEIDRFTDSHQIVKKVKHSFFHEQRHFSGVVTDIIFDYFLASNWQKYSNKDLKSFSKETYMSLEKHLLLFNKKGTMTFKYMKQHDWLSSYAAKNGILKILEGMANRSKHPSIMPDAIKVIDLRADELELLFFDFFDELYVNCQKFLIDHHLMEKN